MRVNDTVGVQAAALLASMFATSAYSVTPPAEIVIPGEWLLTESLTSTSDGTVIIGSIAGRTIFRAQPGAAIAQAWIQPGTQGLAGIFGVLADDRSNTLWACSGNPFAKPTDPTPPPSALYAFDLGTGAYKAHYQLPTPGAFCNDIAIDEAGNAYVTDTNNMQVVRLEKGASSLAVWSEEGAYGPRGSVLDGIVVLGDRVLVNTLVTSKLWSTPIGSDGKAGSTVEVKLDSPLEQPDGMRSFGKHGLLIAEGGSGGLLSKISLDGNSGKRTVLKQGFPDGPVSVTLVGTTAYVLEGQLESPPLGGAPARPFKATAVEVGRPGEP